MQERVVEAYIGEYASGKSENAVNRPLKLAHKGEKVVLVDLDLVGPFYTLRPIKKLLQERNIEVIAWETQQLMGVGEAGSILKPEMRWVLKKAGNIILDIGYGVEGAKILNLLEGAKDHPLLKVYVVVNTARPATASIFDIVEYVGNLGNVHGLISNTHLGDETEVDVIQEGARIVTEAAKQLNLPVIQTTVEKRLENDLGAVDICGNCVQYIERYIPQTYW